MKTIVGGLLGMLFAATVLIDIAAAADCIVLDRIVLHDDIPTGTDRKKLFEPYLHQCVDGALIKALMNDIANDYMSRGYITTRPYLKQQDIKDGELEISLMKGFVEEIVESSTGHSSERIRSAFAFQKGEPLNLRNLETSLEMVNRPPSVDAKFNIKPGTRSGASIVEISSEETSNYGDSLLNTLIMLSEGNGTLT